MRVLVVLGHPNPASFSHAIANTTVQTLRDGGHEVIFHDLYAEGFDPIMPTAELGKGAVAPLHIDNLTEELLSADGLVFVHPNWWGQPPAVLKGWVDRVVRVGVAYKFEEVANGVGRPVGLLKARMGVVFNTSNTPRDKEIKMFGDPLETLWKSCIFAVCGVTNFHRTMFAPVMISTPEQRKMWLDDVREAVERCFPRERS